LAEHRFDVGESRRLRLLLDHRKESSIDLDGQHRARGADLHRDRDGEDPRSGADVGNDVAGLQRERTDHVLDLQSLHAAATLEHRRPFLRWTSAELCVPRRGHEEGRDQGGKEKASVLHRWYLRWKTAERTGTGSVITVREMAAREARERPWRRR